MKKITLLLLLTTVTFAQKWEKNKIKGNGNVVTQIRTTAPYDEIYCGGAFLIELTNEVEGKITAEGDENLLNLIKIEVADNKLKVTIDRGIYFDSRGDKIKITIPVEKISRIDFAGSGTLKTRDKIITENLEILLSGSGSTVIETDTSTLKAVLSGSGRIEIKGASETLNAKLSGSGSMVCNKLNSQNATILLSGSGSIDVNCAKALEAKISGSGTIYYSGNPSSVVKKISGSGEVTRI